MKQKPGLGPQPGIVLGAWGWGQVSVQRALSQPENGGGQHLCWAQPRELMVPVPQHFWVSLSLPV